MDVRKAKENGRAMDENVEDDPRQHGERRPTIKQAREQVHEDRHGEAQ
jgi:hypothetical protein